MRQTERKKEGQPFWSALQITLSVVYSLAIQLSNKQQFPVFGQSPHFVVDYQFQFVDVIADFF